MAKKKLEVGDLVKVKKGEGVSVPFQGRVNKLYENAALLEVDESASPNPIAILNLPNNFLVVRQSLCTVVGHQPSLTTTKKREVKKTEQQKAASDPQTQNSESVEK